MKCFSRSGLWLDVHRGNSRERGNGAKSLREAGRGRFSDIFQFSMDFYFLLRPLFCGRLSPIHLGLVQFFLSLFQTVISFFLGGDFPFFAGCCESKSWAWCCGEAGARKLLSPLTVPPKTTNHCFQVSFVFLRFVFVFVIVCNFVFASVIEARAVSLRSRSAAAVHLIL